MSGQKEIVERLDNIERMLVQLLKGSPQVSAPSEVVDVEAIRRLAQKTAKHGKGVVHDFNSRR